MAEHGKYSTYTNHKCRCKLCRKANADWCRKRRAERVALVEAGLLAVPHGTDGGYRNYGCRCTDCRKAHAKRRASYRVSQP